MMVWLLDRAIDNGDKPWVLKENMGSIWGVLNFTSRKYPWNSFANNN